MSERARSRRAAICVAALVASTAFGASVQSAGADAVLDVPVTTVVVGQPLVFTASGCTGSDPEGEALIEGSLVVGTGDGAVRAGIVDSAPGGASSQVIPMGWVDPDEPAFLSVRCLRQPFDGPATVVSTYPEVPIDLVAPAAPVPTLDVAFARTTAAGGQALHVTGTGCEATVIFELYAGTDRSFRTIIARNQTALQDVPVADDGSFDGLLYLNDRSGPLSEGPYVVSTYCDLVPEDRDLARPVLVTVDGTNPSDQISVAFDTAGRATLSGAGCTDERQVTAQWVGVLTGTGDENSVEEVHAEGTATPSGDGTWTLPLGDAPWDWVDVTTDCGDPATDGFHYLDTSATRGTTAGPTTTTVVSEEMPRAEPTAAIPIPATATYTG